MGRARIAFAAEESILLTIHAEELLAYDAITGDPKWQLRFDRALAGVVFACGDALQHVSANGNPWRTPASGTVAIAVDRGGGIHAIDATVGRVLGSLTEAAPIAIASSVDAFAIALSDRVLLWREGVRHEVAQRATAIAFSRDGSLFACGNARGELRVMPVATRELAKPVQLDGFVTAIAPRRTGEWVVATDEGILHVNGKTVARLRAGDAQAIVCDGTGNALAVRRSEEHIAVWDWPNEAVARVTLTGQRIEDIAFAGSLLGIALDSGDANVVDLTTLSATYTKAPLGRSLRSWTCHVESEKDHVARYATTSPMASRFGLGALFTLIVVVGTLGYLSSSTHQSWVPSPQFLAGDQCNQGCERSRLATLIQSCKDRPELACAGEAEEAQAAFDADACNDARQSLARVDLALKARDGGADEVVSAQRAMAEVGLASCNVYKLGETKRAELLRLAGPHLVVTSDSSPLIGDDPRALWVAEDGDVFIGMLARTGRCSVSRKSAAGWRAGTDSLDCRSIALYGRNSTEVYAALGSSVRRFDGTKWVDLGFAGAEIRALTGVPGRDGDLFVADALGTLRRHHGDAWHEELLPSAPAFSLASGDRWVWAGAWTPFPQASDRGGLSNARGELWVAPDGKLFTAHSTQISISANKGATWTDYAVPAFVDSVWGRSSTDVYAGGPSGLVHFDGTTWTPTGFSGHIRALSGNATDVYVLADR